MLLVAPRLHHSSQGHCLSITLLSVSTRAVSVLHPISTTITRDQLPSQIQSAAQIPKRGNSNSRPNPKRQKFHTRSRYCAALRCTTGHQPLISHSTSTFSPGCTRLDLNPSSINTSTVQPRQPSQPTSHLHHPGRLFFRRPTWLASEFACSDAFSHFLTPSTVAPAPTRDLPSTTMSLRKKP